MKGRTRLLFAIAASAAVVVAAAAPVSARAGRVRTVTATYSHNDVTWAELDVVPFAWIGTGVGPYCWLPQGCAAPATSHVFAVPRWARSTTIAVVDSSQLPVQYYLEVDTGYGYTRNRVVCGDKSPTLDKYEWEGTQTLWVFVATGVWNGCTDPVSAPTTGRIIVTFKS